MLINVHLYAGLRYYLPAGEKSIQESEWNMPEGSTIRQVLERLNLPKGTRVTVLLNNNSVDSTAALKEGDLIHIIPQMAGG